MASSLLHDIRDLALGSRCAACSRLGASLCDTCRATLRTPCLRLPGRSTFAAHHYEGVSKAAIIAYKEHGDHGVGPFLAQSLALCVAEALHHLSAPWQMPVTLVPVPGRPGRSFDHAQSLATMAGAMLRRAGAPAACVPLLTSGPRAALKGLGRQARAAEIAGTMSLAGRARVRLNYIPTSVILVDDVITTGATTTEARRELGAAGLQPLATCAVAATDLHR